MIPDSGAWNRPSSDHDSQTTRFQGVHPLPARSPNLPDVQTWPHLPLDAWQDTYATLHMWTQVVGKTRLALAPMENHWWQVTLLPTARGLVAPAMPAGSRTLDIEFDFLDHRL